MVAGPIGPLVRSKPRVRGHWPDGGLVRVGVRRPIVARYRCVACTLPARLPTVLLRVQRPGNARTFAPVAPSSLYVVGSLAEGHRRLRPPGTAETGYPRASEGGSRILYDI
jgi:hypothetical protein